MTEVLSMVVSFSILYLTRKKPDCCAVLQKSEMRPLFLLKNYDMLSFSEKNAYICKLFSVVLFGKYFTKVDERIRLYSDNYD